jgi:translation initiation factor 1
VKRRGIPWRKDSNVLRFAFGVLRLALFLFGEKAFWRDHYFKNSFFMAKKSKPDSRGFVYSTDPNFNFEEEQFKSETLPARDQKLTVRLETKHRAGKAVTLVNGYIGKDEDLQDLAKKLKNYCGTGGSAKDGVIIIQGDQREKILQWLNKNSYKAKNL